MSGGVDVGGEPAAALRAIAASPVLSGLHRPGAIASDCEDFRVVAVDVVGDHWFRTITGDDWRRAIARGRATENAVSGQIAERVRCLR